jgi:transcriptional regulator with XRE-family HTH domain
VAEDRPPGPTFPERFDYLIRTRRITAREVARQMAVSHTHVMNLRRGNSRVGLGEIQQLAEIFGVSPAWLAGFTTDRGDAGVSAVTANPTIRAIVLELAGQPLTLEESAAAVRAVTTYPPTRAVALQLARQPISPEGTAAILEIIKHVQAVEAGRLRDHPPRESGTAPAP